MISIHVYVLFGIMLILSIWVYWFTKIMTLKEFKKGQNKLLDEIRKLCNELLKIKDRGTIVITSLSLSEKKGPSQVIVTTLPKGELSSSNYYSKKEN